MILLKILKITNRSVLALVLSLMLVDFYFFYNYKEHNIYFFSIVFFAWIITFFLSQIIMIYAWLLRGRAIFFDIGISLFVGFGGVVIYFV